MYLIAMPWLVYNLTGSALGMGSMFLVEAVPYVFLPPLAGVLADRFSRKLLMAIASTVEAGCIALVILLNVVGLLRIEYVYLIGFLLSCASATYMVLNDTVVPQLFREELLARANAMVQFLETSTLLAGTLLAGVLIALIGVFGLFTLITTAYAVVALLTTFLRMHSISVAEEAYQEAGGVLRDLKSALNFVVKHRVIGPLVLLNLLANIAVASVTALLIYFTRSKLGLSSTEVGFIYGAAGAAEIVGVLLVSRLDNKRFSPVKVMLACQFVFAAGVLWVAFSGGMIAVAIGMMLQNGSIVLYNVFSRTLRQSLVPAALLGRVNGIFLTLGQVAFPLSGFFSAVLADLFGVQSVFTAVGAFSLLIAIVYWLSPFRRSLPAMERNRSEALSIEQHISR